MIALYDHIQQLQAELRTSISRRERRVIAAELQKAIAQQAALDRDLDAVLDRPPGEGL